MAERVLWNALRRNQLDGIPFRRQHPVGTLILDYFCPRYKVAIEVDGSIHDDINVIQRDKLREENIEAYGYHLIRFRNEEILTNLPRVLSQIREAITAST